MTLHNVHFLDLPNAILLLILKKLDNMDVLYSLLGINNQRLDNIVQKTTFTTILNFESISANDDFCSIILSVSKSLHHLSILSSSINGYPPLSLHNLPSTIFFSSTLTKLCINVNDFNDCLALLDGRLKQLTTFIVQIKYIENVSLQSYDMDDLPDLKSFSLICYSKISEPDNLLVRLLRQSTRFVDGTHIYNEILSHMTRLRTFTFYVSTENYVHDSTLRLSNNDIQETFKNMENQQVNCIVDFVDDVYVLCKVFSLPFRLDHFEWITNNFSTMIFNSVTCLMLFDRVSFKHEFFVRVARAFPLLKYLSVHNGKAPFWRFPKPHPVDNYSPIAEYLHLISLHFGFVSNCYVDQFLNETKTNLPRLIELKINYRQLKSATENFTRNETRRNYAMVKRLIVANSIVFSEDVYRYFPSS
ncbi:unnamed protein product [Rotaria socialis]|uniref:F-box domain-containing protein n=2 Tax=Rotaria socialis TaxID=392032 RepID=A0A818QKF5_9BILA|nr:unnamed protein product [Rotaria socialis]